MYKKNVKWWRDQQPWRKLQVLKLNCFFLFLLLRFFPFTKIIFKNGMPTAKGIPIAPADTRKQLVSLLLKSFLVVLCCGTYFLKYYNKYKLFYNSEVNQSSSIIQVYLSFFSVELLGLATALGLCAIC